MERRNRNILVVLIGIVIVVAMLSSFGLGLFAPDTAKIQLPTPGASQTPEPAGDEGYVRVEITPQTVQYVIEHTLSRPESYGRTVTIEDFWGDGQSGVTRATVWVDGGWTHTTATQPGGTVRHSIVGEGQFWLWYEGSSRTLTGTVPDSQGYVERYWISVDSGLLACAETALEGQLVYRMSAFTVERPVPSGASFELPDGTVLHTVGSDG